MRQHLEELRFATGGRGIYEITTEIQEVVIGSASMEAIGDIFVQSRSHNQVKTETSGNTGGIVGIGTQRTSVDIGTDNAIEVREAILGVEVSNLPAEYSCPGFAFRCYGALPCELGHCVVQVVNTE